MLCNLLIFFFLFDFCVSKYFLTRAENGNSEGEPKSILHCAPCCKISCAQQCSSKDIVVLSRYYLHVVTTALRDLIEVLTADMWGS